MPIIKNEFYKVKPSDSKEWIILESPDGLAVDVELSLMNFRYDCIPKKIKYNGEEIFVAFFMA